MGDFLIFSVLTILKDENLALFPTLTLYAYTLLILHFSQHNYINIFIKSVFINLSINKL